MSTLYVARSTALTKWGSDVGLSKHIYKIGVTGEPVKALVAQGWAGEADWKLLDQEEVDDSLTEALVVERLADCAGQGLQLVGLAHDRQPGFERVPSPGIAARQ